MFCIAVRNAFYSIWTVLICELFLYHLLLCDAVYFAFFGILYRSDMLNFSLFPVLVICISLFLFPLLSNSRDKNLLRFPCSFCVSYGTKLVRNGMVRIDIQHIEAYCIRCQYIHLFDCFELFCLLSNVDHRISPYPQYQQQPNHRKVIKTSLIRATILINAFHLLRCVYSIVFDSATLDEKCACVSLYLAYVAWTW